MSSDTTIYAPDLHDPFVIGLQEMPMPDLPEDSYSNTPKGMPVDYYFTTTFEGLTHTDEYKERLSEMMTERRKDNPQMGNFQPHTDETKAKISESLQGNVNGCTSGYTLSDEFKEKKRQMWLGDENPMNNPESVAKLSATMKVKKKCPHCDMMGNPATLARHIKARHT